MRGTRYGKEDRRCEYGMWEDRDHILLECERWKEQREGIYEKWEEEGGLDRNRVDMDWLLFEEEGIKALKEFGRRTGWMKLRWGERAGWEGGKGILKEDEEERLRRRVLLTSERMKVKRERDLEMGRIRMRRRRAIEKLEREGLGKETLPIASSVSFGAGPGSKRKVFGEIVNEEVRGWGKRVR